MAVNRAGEFGNRRSAARRSRLEAALLLAREPLSLRKLAQLANLADATEARTLLTRLAKRYDERGCAFQVAQVAGGYQLLTRREFAPWVRPQAVVEGEIRLSSPALETLAVVAYRQPVLRAEVEAIRGVACGEILRQLMDRDLLRIVGRSEELGRPLRYGTTKWFLQVFGLCSLDELPWAHQLRRSSTAVDPGSDTMPPTADSTADLTRDEDAA
ncbi:MAG: SMC-Scp complex subunit ScpB [Pirellulales bacterium]